MNIKTLSEFFIINLHPFFQFLFQTLIHYEKNSIPFNHYCYDEFVSL